MVYVGSSYLVAIMRDQVSFNDATMKTVIIVYPHLLDTGCFSHTLDLVGEYFHNPTVSEFGMLWVSLFARIVPKFVCFGKTQHQCQCQSIVLHSGEAGRNYTNN